MEDIFWVAKISNIYLGCLKFLIFFGVNGRCCAREEKMRVSSIRVQTYPC